MGKLIVITKKHALLRGLYLYENTISMLKLRWYPKISNSKLSNPNLSMTILSNSLYYRMLKRSNPLKIEWPNLGFDKFKFDKKGLHVKLNMMVECYDSGSFKNNDNYDKKTKKFV
jgi:hypothetical protein